MVNLIRYISILPTIKIYGNSNGLNLESAGSNDIIIKSNSSGGSSGDVIVNTVQGGYLIAKGADGIELHHNGTSDKKFETTSSGATVTGTLTATAFSGDGSALTNLPASGITTVNRILRLLTMLERLVTTM